MSVIFHLSSTKTIMPNVMLFLRASSSLSCPLCLHPYSDNMCLNGKGKLLHLTTQWSGEAEPRERNSFHLSRAWTVRALERSNFPFGLSSRAPVTKRYPPPLPLPPTPPSEPESKVLFALLVSFLIWNFWFICSLKEVERIKSFKASTSASATKEKEQCTETELLSLLLYFFWLCS